MFYVGGKKKKMSSLAEEPKTRQIFHRIFADKKAEECRGENSPKRREEGKKLKPSVLTSAKEGEWEHCSNCL